MSDFEVRVGPGCLGVVIVLILLWALIFGVNYKGKHYGMSYGCNGVTVEGL